MNFRDYYKVLGVEVNKHLNYAQINHTRGKIQKLGARGSGFVTPILKQKAYLKRISDTLLR